MTHPPKERAAQPEHVTMSLQDFGNLICDIQNRSAQACYRKAAHTILDYGLKFEHDKCGGSNCVYCEICRVANIVRVLAGSPAPSIEDKLQEENP
jgi:hypothetical protein